MLNKLLSVSLIIGIGILSYPLLDQIDLGTIHTVALIVLVLASIVAMAWNFFHSRITSVLIVFVLLSLTVGLYQLYYFLTLRIY